MDQIVNEKPRIPRFQISEHAALGKRIKALRLLAGLSQEDVGKQMGYSFQLQQKLEKGINRIDFVRLQKLATLFNVPMTAFIVDGGLPAEQVNLLPENTQTKRLLQAFRTISSERDRKALLALAYHFAYEDNGDDQTEVS